MSYTGELANPVGGYYRPLNDVISLEFARSFGNIGELRVTVPDDLYNPQVIRRNWRITLWRHITGKAPILVGKTIWFIRSVEWDVMQGLLTFHAQDAIGLLKDRIVAYTPQTFYADKTIEELGSTPFADDSIHDYLTENFGADALNTDRDASAYLIVPDSSSDGAQVNKEAAWQDILSVLQDVCRMSAQLGVPILFDISVNENGVFVFNSWIGRRGTDRTTAATDTPHVFSPEQNNLSDLKITWDYSQEKNVAYVGGYDSGSARVVVEVVDDTRVRSDPFARAEVFVDGGDSDLESVLQDVGRIALEGFRAVMRAEATTIETPESIYGVHYDYGDTVPLVAKGIEIACDISAVSGSYGDGKDLISLRLTGQRQL